MVSHDLVQLHEAYAVLLEPRREALVQLCSGRLRQRVVGRVPDQQVAEAVGVLAGKLRLVGPDELLADQAVQARLHLRLFGSESLHGATVEDSALDRAALEHATLGRLELVEPRGEQCLDRPRHGDLAVARVLDERDHLLDEERVSFRRVADPLLESRLEAVVAEQLLEQLVGLCCAQRLEQDRRRVELATAPARALVQQFRSREAEEQQRRVPREIGDVLEQVEEGWLAPVDVVEDGHEGG